MRFLAEIVLLMSVKVLEVGGVELGLFVRKGKFRKIFGRIFLLLSIEKF